MSNYEKIFEPYYEGGWEAYPLETTLITAGALNDYDAALMHIEDYLDTQPDPNDNLAETYSDEETYEAGDYRIYNGVLYKCLEDIDEAEEFDPTKWESCLVTDEMATSGGTTVVANPVGTPTDDLETIQIGETIYDIPGGGGGNANIWTGTQAELEEVFDDLAEGTQINITDDEQEVVEGGTIYSEDEQVIGLWIDSKPLYQKTLAFNTAVEISMTAWTDVNSAIPNIGYENIVRAFGLDTNGTYQGDFLCGLNASSHVQLQSQRNGTGNISSNYITLQYTKTTDSPLDLVIGKSTMYIASSDCYSTVEKEVGCWSDGKPLYQRTFNFSTAISATSNTWVDTGVDIANAVVVDAEAVLYQSDGNLMVVECNIGTDGSVYVLNPRSVAMDINTLTLRYTKTTDTAGSGQYTPASGKAIHYSTDEQVIGTWVDGSTVYQKIILHSGVIAGAQTATQIAHGISNLGRIIEAEATVYDDHSSPSWMSVPRIAYDANNIGFSGIDDAYINFYVPSAFQNRIKDAHFILKYTKSSS